VKYVFLEFTDTGATNTGPIQLLGGTGAYTTLSGHGIDNGVSTGDTAVGSISGSSCSLSRRRPRGWVAVVFEKPQRGSPGAPHLCAAAVLAPQLAET
jgi:hypothetical protein